MLYPKLETLFNRFPKGHEQQFKVDETQIRRPEYTMFDTWLVTEKIDGMNIGVDFIKTDDVIDVVFHGRSYKAQLPKDLVKVMEKLFTEDKMVQALMYRDGLPERTTLFMEGYGPGIQKGGGRYRSDKSVRVFDINVDGVWMNWESITDIASKLGVETVPVYELVMDTDAIVAMVKEGVSGEFYSLTAAQEDGHLAYNAEGVVARTNPLLLDRMGRRVMWKLKVRDFSKQEML